MSCTKNYKAPELYKDYIDFNLGKVDIFALAVILLNLLTGKYSFDQAIDLSTNEYDK